MTRVQEFQELRPLLFSIAYRILGSVSEAEDAVQEAWLRYEASPAQPASAKSFRSAVVTRISIDVLRSARVRRATYVGPWFPEPLLTDPSPSGVGDRVCAPRGVRPSGPASPARPGQWQVMAQGVMTETVSGIERRVTALEEYAEQVKAADAAYALAPLEARQPAPELDGLTGQAKAAAEALRDVVRRVSEAVDRL